MRKTNENIRDFRASRTDAEPIARKIKYGDQLCHFGERCKMPIPFSLHLQGKGLLACIKPFPYKNGHTGRTIAFALCNAHAGFCRMAFAVFNRRVFDKAHGAP